MAHWNPWFQCSKNIKQTFENIVCFANLHFFAEVIFWCEFYTFGAPCCVSGWIWGSLLKKCTSFWGGAKGSKGYQNETREALKAKMELIKIVKQNVVFYLIFATWGSQDPPQETKKYFFQASKNHEQKWGAKRTCQEHSRDTCGRLKGGKGGPKGGTVDIEPSPGCVILEPSPRLRIQDPWICDLKAGRL